MIGGVIGRLFQSPSLEAKAKKAGRRITVGEDKA